MQNTQENVLVSSENLKAFTRDVLQGAGLLEEDAEIIAESLLYANLAGHHSHGVTRLNDYLVRLDRGLVEKRTKVNVISETSTTMLLDANNGWGQVVSKAAVQHAVEKAQKHGSSWVFVRNSNHYGTASYWTSRIAVHGMVGISMTNGSPVMAPYGSKEPSLGTNPISIAVPSRSGRPIFLDMATSNQARGKITLAAKNKQPIPSDWAITKDGRPTTDPQEALEGSLLPVGGPKGSGLAIFIDIMTGVLTGALFGKQVPQFYNAPDPQQIGHTFAAIDIGSIMPMEAFQERLEQKEEETRASSPAAGFDRVMMPGDLEHDRMSKQRQEGIWLTRQIFEELVQTANRYNVITKLEHQSFI